MKINIKDKEVELKYSFRCHLIFESISGESYKGGSLSQIITLFYSFIMGSDTQLAVTFDEYLEWLDEHPETIEEFSNWFMHEAEARKGITKEQKKTSKKKENK